MKAQAAKKRLTPRRWQWRLCNCHLLFISLFIL